MRVCVCVCVRKALQVNKILLQKSLCRMTRWIHSPYPSTYDKRKIVQTTIPSEVYFIRLFANVYSYTQKYFELSAIRGTLNASSQRQRKKNLQLSRRI